jgi:glycosidase
MNRSAGAFRAAKTFVWLWVALAVAQASTLKISSGSKIRARNEVEADYTISHIFVNEDAGDSVPITIFFDPGTLGVQSAEVFTNLNRRAFATADANHDGIEDGIMPPSGNGIAAGDDKNYFKAYPLAQVAGGYEITLQARQCGAYRLTARYRLNADPPGIYRWYGDEVNGQGIHKRDHAVVVSPSPARSLQIYEANPLTILATGLQPNQRGTFTDMAAGLPAGQKPRFSLKYLTDLGINGLWLQPIHPRGLVNRQTDPATNQPFLLGSPYSVKDFFSVMPLMARTFSPGSTPESDDTPSGRAQAEADFAAFVKSADAAGVQIILDAPFNHTAADVELSTFGQKAWGGSPTDQIRNTEARFFSRAGEYDMRAFNAASIANAPDRNDFGKWSDVMDIYFGRYAALVANSSQTGNFMNEGDWFDYSTGDENSAGDANGHFDSVTQKVWHYFGDYLQFWLTQTGYPDNPTGNAIKSTAGIDGLRADFGQGLPPQCWEYLINRTRARKWNFVFMAESLDGGPVTYRSSRHFDILNERIIYDLHHATKTSDFRALYVARRQAYGDALVLLNTASHDEDIYKNPYDGFARFAVNSAVDGVTMIFPGQELGLRGTVVPPGDSNPAAGPPFGYDRYESPFFGKPIPAFKTYNSMMPLWSLNPSTGDVEHLSNLYSAVGQARRQSPALQSTNRAFLNLMNGASNEQIFGIAKFERRNASPKDKDVVFAFVNLTVNSDQATPDGALFDVDVDEDGDGMNDFGIQADHKYNVRNIAAYTGANANRREQFLWSQPRTGADILKNGIFVKLNGVPANDGSWATAPYEAQYLKVFDVGP